MGCEHAKQYVVVHLGKRYKMSATCQSSLYIFAFYICISVNVSLEGLQLEILMKHYLRVFVQKIFIFYFTVVFDDLPRLTYSQVYIFCQSICTMSVCNEVFLAPWSCQCLSSKGQCRLSLQQLQGNQFDSILHGQ